MIQVGEVLDKYELIERVGQGGMAVVYRGLDRSLKRVVAVKILHKHLADYQEARDRFEREAQAVAKLRHENILEIFDYSGAAAAERAGSSYIVTEFIDGRTLKQVVTDRPIQFPELGAMIVLQVCRALAHAHAAGILHRDVKPENIMVRSDGVVKLMDFGISHMVDLERLTVTGQLLGSPAYMAPEHVEGRQLDFRTDVFAAGIVLYQLTVGKLPFEGKNPHEVLKRIAECKYTDPRQINPQIGNRLGRIIVRAMAAEPNDRFPAVSEMVLALESYLEESGIAGDRVASELARYFQSPVSYEQAFETRLIDHLTARGTKLLADDQRAAALDVFDRVLTVDPDNAKVLAILDGINRKRRIRHAVLGGAMVAVLAACAYAIQRSNPPEDGLSLDRTGLATTAQPNGRSSVTGREDPIAPEATTAIDAAPANDQVDAAAATSPIDSGEPRVTATASRIVVSPARGSTLQIGDGEWLAVPDDGVVVAAIEHDAPVRVRNRCCPDEVVTAHAGQPTVSINLTFRAGAIIATCKEPDVDVKFDNARGSLGTKREVFFEGMLDSRSVTVEFVGKGWSDQQRVTVRSGATETVTCVKR